MKSNLILLTILLCSVIFSTSSVSAQGTDGTWTTLSSTGFTPRTGLTSAAINGKIYVIDGFSPTLNWVHLLEVFDPSSNSWSSPATKDSAISRYLITSVVYNNRIFVFGGTKGSDLTTVEEFDPSTNTWITPKTTGTFTARDALTAAVVGNKIYVIGGENNSGPVNTIEVFDPAANSWSAPQTTGTFVPTLYLTSSVVGDKIYVMGGYDGSMDLNTLVVFDPSTNTWSTPVTTATFTPRDKLCSCVLGGKIYVLGGTDNGQTLNTMEVFDPATNQWSIPVTSGTFTPRSELTCSVVNGQIYALGGLSDDEVTVLNTNEVFKPAVNDVESNNISQEIQIIPNPTTGNITISGIKGVTGNISIMNLLGETVMEQKNLSGTNITLDFTKLVPGTYYIRFSSANSVVTKMVVRE